MDLKLCIILGLLQRHLVTSWTFSDAGTLQTALLNGYVTNIRPSQRTIVNIQIGISSLNDLDIVSQKVELLGFLFAYWNDTRLSWDPSLYGNIIEHHVTVSHVWAPPLVLNNAAESMKVLSDNQNLDSIPVSLSSSGEVSWLVPISFSASCSVNIAYYPFDKQTCNLVVSTWLYGVSDLTIIPSSLSINKDLYDENGEWIYSKGEVKPVNRTIEGFAMSAVEFTLTFERRQEYYVINVILPVTVLNCLGFLVFLLPVDSGERIGYALTILLSLSVVLSAVSDNIPTTSTSTCILSVYLLVTFMTSALEAFLTVLTLRVYLREDAGSPLSSGSYKFMSKCLVPFSRYRKVAPHSAETDSVKDMDMKLSESNLDLNNTANDKQNRHKSDWKNKNGGPDAADGDGDVCFTYKDFAKALDIINFYVFMILTLLTTLIFFLILKLSE